MLKGIRLGSNKKDRDGLVSFQMAPSANGTRRLFFHRNTPADKGVIKQIFEDEDYRLERLRRAPALMAFYNTVLDADRAPLIIDAGANIGASALYFHGKFPDARICCFEPAPENVAVLLRNTAGLDIEVHNEAVGRNGGFVSLEDPGEGEWGFRTAPNPHGSIKMTSISDFVETKTQRGLVPFILKIDIEGGEDGLFEAPNEWVDEFAIVIIELHDWLLPKRRTSRSFLKYVADRDRDFVHIGENIFSISNKLID